MQPKTTTLSNGLRIITAEMPGVYSVAVAIAVGVGSRHEQFDTNGGVSHFLEHLLFKGTKNRPTAQEISEAIDGVGGIHNAYTSNDLTNFHIRLPKEHADLAMEILADTIRNPLFEPAEVDRERDVVVEEMKMLKDDPGRYVHDLVPQLLWPEDPLGQEIIGSEQVIRSIKPDAIRAFQQKHYAPENMVVAVAGGVEHETVVQQMEHLMGDMAMADLPKAPVIKGGLSSQLCASEQRDINQAHLAVAALGYPYGHKLDMAARVMANILGSGSSSRLFLELREKRGLAYAVYADYHNFVDTGLLEIYAGVGPDKAEEALEALMGELKRIADEPVEASELTRVKNKISGLLQMSMENTFAVADRFGVRYLLTGQVKTVEQTLAEIHRVSPEDIMAAAQDLLEPSKLRLAQIAPEPAKAEAKFKALLEK